MRMTNWIISSSLLIIVVLFLRHILRGRISLRIQYAIWLLVAVRLLVPLNFGSTVLSIENYTNQLTESAIETTESQSIVTPPTSENEYKVKVYDNVVKDTAADESMANVSTNIKSGYNILKNIWVIGMVGIGLTFIISNLIFTLKVTSSRKRITVDNCKLPVYLSDKLDTPCLFHVFRPAIYLTYHVINEEKLLLHTITHELTHYRHGDLLWNIVRCSCLIVHWYNPLVWLAAIISKRDCELACDESTIKKLGEQDRLEYGKTLIQLTCQKPAELFLASTSMTSGKKGLKERIRLIAAKPHTTLIGCIILVVILLITAGCTFTKAVSEETILEEKISEEEQENIETPRQIIQKEPEDETLKFYDEPDGKKVCLAVMPDGISKAGGDYRYIIPEDQVKWTDEYKQARSLATDGSWMDGERSAGIWIVFQDEWTCITEQGFIFDFSKRVDKSEAESFYDLCIEEARKYGTGTPVNPENISTLTSATLNYNGAHAVTDSTILAELSTNLYFSTELRGGAACPFTASLTLEFRDQSTETIYLATDSCSSWLTDGVYYDYSGYEDINEIYEIFQQYAITESGELVNKISNAELIMKRADERLRDGYKEATLTYVDNSEVGWDYHTDNPWKSDEERDALAQAAIKELYTLTGFQIEECVYTTDGRSKFIFGKSAEYIGKSIAFYTRDYGFTLYGDAAPYMGFANARRVHFSDVQQLDSPYGKAELGGHGAIPAWFLKHSGIYQGERITGFDAFNLDDTVYTHIKLFFDGGYYVVVMDEDIESFHEAMGPYYE